MSVDQLPNPRSAALSPESKLVRYDEFIEQQIQSTRRMVKLVDLASVLVTLVTSVAAYLLLLAVVEHWLVPGGFSVGGRFVLFALLAGGTAYYAYRHVWPLCWRAINPVYAARTIEQSSPSLKNTLVNLLMFRERRREVSDAVYHTLEEQAAQRLTRVPVEAAVDRGHLIRLGYVLIGVTAFAAVYKVASPKDPVTTAERVLMPWADIVPASRVQISAVEPGNVTIARGESIKVAAEIRGLAENDPVVLRYTTADGRAVRKPVTMSSVGGGPRFECRLPANGEADALLGIGQNLTYHLEAGDARSHTFEVTVVTAPAIMVQRVEYDFPDYTGEPDRAVDGIGDIRAIEGTKITIHARANGPIDEAFLDFDADGRRDVRFAHEVDAGKASFVLALRDDRQTPKFSSYVVRFTNKEGRANSNPVKHSIDVLRDLDPELTLVAPREKTLDVRLDETVAIEVDARDPDFALSEVRLRGEAIGRPNVDVVLLNKPQVGRFTGRYSFTPREHRLQAGDVVQYWVTASDNRAPAANTAKTERQTFRIVAADPARPPQTGGERRGQQRPQPGENKQDDKQGGEGKAQGGAEQAGGRGSRGERGESGNREEQPSRGNPPGGGEQAGANSPDGKQEKQGRPGDPSASGGGREQTNPGQDNAGRDEQKAAGGGEGSRGSEGKQEGGEAKGGNAGGRNSRGQRGGESSSDQNPISSNGDNDSEAMNRIREHLQRSNELPKEGEANNAERQGANAESQNGKQQPTGDEGTTKQRGNPQDKTNGSPREGQRSGERREGSPSEGGRDAATKEPAGQGDKAGANQRVRDEKSGTPMAEKREQTPQGESTGKNEGSRGRHVPDSAGNEGADLPDETKDSVTNKQVNRDGANKTGQSEAANEGAGEADERGAGNDSSSAGRDTPSAEKTGQAGAEKAGRGSSRRDGEGNQRGGERGDGKTAGRGANGGEDATPGGDSADKQPNDRGGSESRRGGARGSNRVDGEKSDAEAGKEQGADSSKGGQGDAKGERGEGKSDESPPGNDGRSVGSRGGGNQEGAKGRDAKRGDEKSNGDRGGESKDSQPGGKSDQANTNQPGAPTGDGGQFGTSDATPQGDGFVPEGDAANLEYARKQTDLVLEKLSDQLNKKQVDKSLLERLGWTEEDMRKFVSRWQQRKEASRIATPAGDAARKDLDDALRSLGLRPGQLRPTQSPDDAMRDLRQGYRGGVPQEFRDRLRDYNQGVSRSRQSGGGK